jgi:hypothetical protein
LNWILILTLQQKVVITKPPFRYNEKIATNTIMKQGQFSSDASERSKYQRKYNSRPEQKKRRAQRNAARKAAEAVHGKEKLKGKDVDHTARNKTGSLNNNKTRIVDVSTNRSMNGQGSSSSPTKPAKKQLDKKINERSHMRASMAAQMKKKKAALSGGVLLGLTRKMAKAGSKAVKR